jgi:hypothetical protein
MPRMQECGVFEDRRWVERLALVNLAYRIGGSRF